MNNEIVHIIENCHSEAAKRLVGQEQLVDDILTAFIAGGHVLLEGVPGLAKTLAIKTVAEILGCGRQSLRKGFPHLEDVRGYFGLLEENGNVCVHQAVSSLKDEVVGPPEKDLAVYPLEFRAGIREMMSDIAEGKSSQKGVAESMYCHISV